MSILPLVTVIIPTFKRPQFLKRAIQSVLRQSYPHWRLLIADNASGKETAEVISTFKALDTRIAWLQQPKHLSMTQNFQAALLNTQTPYVSFLPDDDFLLPSFFEEALAGFSLHPECVFSGGGGLLMESDYSCCPFAFLGKRPPPPTGYYPPPQGFFAYMRSSFAVAFPSLVFCTETLHKIGGFDAQLAIGIDEALISQCASCFPVYFQTARPLYCGWQHSGSLSKQTDFACAERELEILFSNLKTLPFQNNEQAEIRIFFQQRIVKLHTQAYKYFLRQRDFARARLYAKKNYAMLKNWRWKCKEWQSWMKWGTGLNPPLPSLLVEKDYSWRAYAQELENLL